MKLLWAILFLIAAFICGVLGFGGIAIAVSFLTKVLFLISLVCFLIALMLIIFEHIQARVRNSNH